MTCVDVCHNHDFGSYCNFNLVGQPLSFYVIGLQVWKMCFCIPFFFLLWMEAIFSAKVKSLPPIVSFAVIMIFETLCSAQCLLSASVFQAFQMTCLGVIRITGLTDLSFNSILSSGPFHPRINDQRISR
jgi:hypothetical protein